MLDQEKTRQQMLAYQRNEITEHHIYHRLARLEKSHANREILERIAQDEMRHYAIWRAHTGHDVKPNLWMVWRYCWISRILGLTFGIKLMEGGEDAAQKHYQRLVGVIDGVETMAREESDHEARLLGLLDEERLHYMGSMVLGLNDALVELTGALAGLTLALRNVRLIALSGLIIGIAAAMSMAASEYLSTKAEKSGKNPLKSAAYTGVAYIITVMLLVAPYLLLNNPFHCLSLTLIAAMSIIAAFNYYVSVATDRPFARHFMEMAGVSLGVAILSFGMGYVIRTFLGVDV
ncbi:MAG: VIT1/CCC1 transporter family protein [Vicinamibacteria bacterium]|nr:VIT1/CCC1 transporter family protein [Vicinamibacteria bacterium]